MIPIRRLCQLAGVSRSGYYVYMKSEKKENGKMKQIFKLSCKPIVLRIAIMEFVKLKWPYIETLQVEKNKFTYLNKKRFI